MSAQLAVFGQPIAHSRSPQIHAQFARQFGLDLEYRAIESAPGEFARLLAEFRDLGGIGANITLPLKTQAATLCTTVSALAARAGAVNTLIRKHEGWHGTNTDGMGLVRDLEQSLGIEVQGKQILLLGAGGAAAGLLSPLLERAPAQIWVWNRNPDRAIALCNSHADLADGHLSAVADDQQLPAVDLVLNATAIGHHGGLTEHLPKPRWRPNGLAYDLSYGATATGFLSWARSTGAERTSDGLGMLVEQAAESFWHWFGLRPHSAPVRDLLRAESTSAPPHESSS